MIEHTLSLGPFQTNAYILGCEETKEGVVIDPGFEPEVILETVEQDGLNIGQILLTHGHVDHVSAVAAVKEATSARVLIHQADKEIYLATPQMAAMFGLQADEQPEPDGFVAEDDEITFGKKKLRVIHTPGHTPGGVCFLCEDEKLVVVGDTLFFRGIGRTDLPGGSMRQLFASIREKLYELDGGIRVLPGHGPHTSLREEMFDNPFVRIGS